MIIRRSVCYSMVMRKSLSEGTRWIQEQERKPVYIKLDHMTCNRYVVINDKEEQQYIRIPNDLWVKLFWAESEDYERWEAAQDLIQLVREKEQNDS